MTKTNNEGDPDKTLYLSKWSTRFWGWLIDIIIVNIAWGAVVRSFALLAFFPSFGLIDVWGHNLFGIGTYSFVIFLYWTAMEGAAGQSIGKMVLNIKVTDRKGGEINFGKAAIESFGKAFLLPIDCLIGWIAMPEAKLRLFNRISNTIVIKTTYEAPEGVRYMKK